MINTYIPLNRISSISRMILSVFIIYSSTEMVFIYNNYEFFLVLSLIYFLISSVSMILSYLNWWIDYHYRLLFNFLDFLFLFFVCVSYPKQNLNELYVIIFLFEIHLVFSIIFFNSIRKSAIPIAFLYVLVSGITVYKNWAGPYGVPSSIAPLLSAGIVILVAAWIASQLRHIALPRFMDRPFRSDVPLTTPMLEYARNNSAASDVVLCWIETDDSRCYIVRSGATEILEPVVVANLSAANSVRDLVPMAFDTTRGVSVRSDGISNITGGASFALPGRPLFTELGLSQGICVPLDINSDIRPWLILSSIPRMSWGHLALAHAICKELSIAVDWFEATLEAKTEALRQLRKTVASDLHDSVAQSLAGAKFLLAALKASIGAGSQAASKIDEIQSALDAENLHVRSLIRQLRVESDDSNEVDILVDLRTTSEILRSRWNIGIFFEDSDFRIMVPIWLSLEIQQLFREAVSNGARHGGASEIIVSCQKHMGKLYMKISNDNPNASETIQNEFSPYSIRERIHSLSGELSVKSANDRIILDICIPLMRSYGDSMHLHSKGIVE